MVFFFIVAAAIAIGCITSFFSKKSINPSYSWTNKSIDPFYSWANEYKEELNLTTDELSTLDYVSEESSFSKYKYFSFLKPDIVFLSISALRALNYNNKSSEKARSICLYCDYILCKRYLLSKHSNSQKSALEDSLVEYEKKTILGLSNELRILTDEEEKKLFSYEIARRDMCYNKLIDEYKDSNKFYEDIKRLESLNDAFTVKRNFYYKAYRFMIDKDQLIAVKLYIHYINVNPDSTTNLSISKSNLKKLFKTEPQRTRFEKIIEQFKAKRNLESTLLEVEEIFLVKRKEVILNDDDINSATHDLNSVVEVLNKYLEDEDISELPITKEKEDKCKVSLPISTDKFSPIQSDFIDYFISHSYKLSNIEIDDFAKAKEIFRSQLIDGLNEKYFDLLDDFLIEEENNYFVLNQSYFNRIIQL